MSEYAMSIVHNVCWFTAACILQLKTSAKPKKYLYSLTTVLARFPAAAVLMLGGNPLLLQSQSNIKWAVSLKLNK